MTVVARIFVQHLKSLNVASLAGHIRKVIHANLIEHLLRTILHFFNYKFTPIKEGYDGTQKLAIF